MSISKVSSDSLSIIMSFLDNKSKTSLASTSSSIKSLSKGTGITLKIDGDDLKRKIQGISDYWTINKLHCRNPKDILPLAGRTNVKRLILDCCDTLTGITALSGRTGLHSLVLCKYDNITGISEHALSGLEELILVDCNNLSDISALHCLSGLRSLCLYSCRELKNLSIMSSLPCLNLLRLHRCENLKDISALETLTDLRKLDISWCKNLKDNEVSITYTNK